MDTINKKCTLDGFSDDPLSWLLSQAKAEACQYLLVIADDAVGFGKVERGALKTDDALAQVLSKQGISKLQQLYLFGQSAQLLVWRSDGAFHCSLIRDEQDSKSSETLQQAFRDETYLLWGSATGNKDSLKFSMMAEEARGFKFSLPKTITKGKSAGLKVRHYYKADDDGQAFIAFSRLVDIVQVS